MTYWAKHPIERTQSVLFSPTLDSSVPADSPVRLFDDLLGRLDWSDWESCYDGRIGRPPYHPRVLCAAVLYGLTHAVRSSRALEDACRNRLDFIWLAHGHQPDHATFAEFRTGFADQLKAAFRRLNAMAVSIGAASLVRVALDGSRIRANSSRHETAGADAIERRMEELDAEFAQAMELARREDERDDALYGKDRTPNRLPRRLADLGRRRELLDQALKAARERARTAGDEARAPVADPQCRIMPDKEGVQAPAYTTLATVESRSGLIVDAEVVAEPVETSMTVETVKRVEASLGERPAELVADKHHCNGPALQDLREMGVEPIMPLPGKDGDLQSPARRPDGSQPVPAGQWAQLPRRTADGRFDKGAFLYDRQCDCYWCPMGNKLEYWYTHEEKRNGRRIAFRRYRARACCACPARSECIKPGAKARSVRRDQYEGEREAMLERLAGERAREALKQRRHIAETPFALIKGRFGLRQFYMRGLAKVRVEWLWACLAYNVKRLTGMMKSGRIAWEGVRAQPLPA